MVKVHVHTNHPGLVFEEGLKLGASLSRMKVDTVSYTHLMISYNTLKLNLESTETQCEYYKAIYDNTVLKKNSGSATDIEVKAAKAGYISAQSSKEQAKASLNEVYKLSLIHI